MDAELSSHLIEFAIDEVIRHFETFANQERQIRRVRHKSLSHDVSYHEIVHPGEKKMRYSPYESQYLFIDMRVISRTFM